MVEIEGPPLTSCQNRPSLQNDEDHRASSGLYLLKLSLPLSKTS